TFEVALSCALLVAAGLMVKSIVRANTVRPGYETKRVLTARVGFPSSSADTIAQWRFFDQLLERIATLPGVEAAAMSSGLPGTRASFSRTRFGVEGGSYRDDDARPVSRFAAVSPSFFTTLEIPVIAGRPFTPADRDGSEPVAVVTRSFARRYLRGDPVGQR